MYRWCDTLKSGAKHRAQGLPDRVSARGCPACVAETENSASRRFAADALPENAFGRFYSIAV